MEDQGDDVRSGACASPKQEERYRGIKKHRRPARDKSDPLLLQQWTDNRQVATRVQPDAQGLCLQEPIAVDLGYAREEVHQRQLHLHRAQPHQRDFHRSGQLAPMHIEAERPVRGHETQQQRQQAHEVIVVQVRGHVDQFHVGEEQEEKQRRPPVEQTDRDQRCAHQQHREHRIHPFCRERLHPTETEVGEVEYRIHVQRMHPTLQ